MTSFLRTPRLRQAYISTTTRLPTAARAATPIRPLSRRRTYATKSTQDKDSLDPVSTEHSKSGGDHAAVHDINKTAFDSSQTRPEEAHADAEKESGSDSNPLQVSPANQEVSRPGGGKSEVSSGTERGAESAEKNPAEDYERSRTSGKGKSPKHGDGKSGGGGGTYN